MIKQNILIVDDEPINLSIVAEILSQKYSIRVATNGRTALDIINKEKPDLILLDIMMPDMDGYEVAYQLKHNKSTSDIPIIFLTAKSDSENIVKGFKEGAVDYISKPFAKEELLARVHNHLQINKLKNALTIALLDVQKKVTELDILNSDLSSNKAFLQSILDYTSHAIIATTKDGVITLFNQVAEKLLGYTSQELVGKETPFLFHDKAQVEQRAKELSEELNEKVEVGFDVFTKKSKLGLKNKDEWIYIAKDEKKIAVNISISVLRDSNGEIDGYIGIAENITEQKKIDKQIKDYINLIDENVITSTTNLNGNIIYASKAFCEISGYTKEELLGKNHRIVRHPDMDKSVYKNLWATISSDEAWQGEIKNRKKDGDFYWVEVKVYPIYDINGKKIGYTGIRQDITDKKKIEEISITDELTKLYNRRYFNEVFAQELNRAKRDGKNIAFLMLDVDHFKLYNDTYGHQNGDLVLSKIGEVLNSCSKRAGDFAFRLGGEEFGMVFSEPTIEEAMTFANSVRESIKKLNMQHSRNSASDVVTASSGLVFIDSHNDLDVNQLYKKADDNLYRAKELGRDRVESSFE